MDWRFFVFSSFVFALEHEKAANMIAFEKVNKIYNTRFGKKQVLKDFTIKFPAGEHVAILGRNGVGKSTIIKLLAGVESPTSGRVICDENLSWPVGFSGALSPNLSAEENCRFIAKLYNEDLERVVDYTCAFADIGDFFFLPIKTYSSGIESESSIWLEYGN